METPSSKFCQVSVEETARLLHTSTERGLETVQEAGHRRSVHGENVLGEDEDDESLLKQFFQQFTGDKMILMLMGSAVVSVLVGNIDDAVSIAIAVTIVVTVGFIQEYRSEQSLKALSTLVPPGAHLTRCGESMDVLASALVPGDLVTFGVGDRVPADVRLVTAHHLTVDESSLTGETHAVDKDTHELSFNASNGFQAQIPVGSRHSIAHMGTLVVTGKGSGIVVGTGKTTEFGKIFEMMSEIEKPKTPLQTSMDKLGQELSMISFAVIGGICLIGLLQGRSLLDLFQIGVSLAVAAIPEGLPIIVTVTLALGVLRMARSKAIVRHLPSVETLGSVNVICSDKTGTLTMNKLTADKIWTMAGWLELAGTKDLRAKEQVLQVVKGSVLCNDAWKTASTATAPAAFVGNPVDVALQNMALRFVLPEDYQATHAKTDETPFDSKRKWMAVATQTNAGPEPEVSVKGALEFVLPLCSRYVNLHGDVVPLTKSVENDIHAAAATEAARGMRLISVAFSQTGETCDVHAPSNLVFAGLVSLFDPPRPGVRESILQLREAGVKVIMITGDNEITAASAARDVGIPVPDGLAVKQYIMTGSTLERLSERELSAAIDSVLVFARTSPEMKVKIVRSLQMRGDIVAMTGDGVNDAPALKLADIGVSMGSGTDVAKEASDMILVDDSFATILGAIKDGKGIFTNIKSFLTFQLSTSVAALSLIVVSTIFKLPNPLNAMQILWINILMDGPPAQSLGVEKVDPAVMSQPPRSRNDHVLTQAVLKRVIWRGMVILAGTMLIYIREMADGVVTARDTTMSFTAFVLFDLFNALTSRSATRSVLEIGLFSNKMFNYAVGLSLLGQLAVIYFPPFQSIFQTEALSLYDICGLLLLTSSILWIDEFIKYRTKQQNNSNFVPLNAQMV